MSTEDFKQLIGLLAEINRNASAMVNLLGFIVLCKAIKFFFRIL